MRSLLFILFPLVFAAVFWAGVDVWPDLASKELLRAIASIFGFAWAGFAFALPKLSELSASEGLTEAERERLIQNISRARAKIWRVGGLSLSCVITLFFLSFVITPETAHLITAFGGLAAGYGCELLLLAKWWFDEIHTFITDVNKHRLNAKSKEEVLKRFANSNGG